MLPRHRPCLPFLSGGSETPDLSSGAQQLCRKPAGVPDIVEEMSEALQLCQKQTGVPGRDARRYSTLLETSRSARRISSARGESDSDSWTEEEEEAVIPTVKEPPVPLSRVAVGLVSRSGTRNRPRGSSLSSIFMEPGFGGLRRLLSDSLSQASWRAYQVVLSRWLSLANRTKGVLSEEGRFEATLLLLASLESQAISKQCTMTGQAIK
ncbi:Hypothetical predicted protein [Pelobates cultripes]|uniref:Uncharacterized protein n=1 Tax=Pelobates cultripes TaxID=61616 RepID=A0AAD1WC87_PELCU|nr:Hypothetical predicted protein [Pelobates cultripes]